MNVVRNRVALLVCASTLFSACLGGGTPDGPQGPPLTVEAPWESLPMDRFKIVANDGAAATWEWKDTVPAYAGTRVSPPPPLTSTFQLPANLPLTVDIKFEREAQGVHAAVLDPDGKVRCFGTPGSNVRRCHLPLPAPLDAPETWRVNVWPDDQPDPATGFRITLVLFVEPRYEPLPVAYGAAGLRAVPPGLLEVPFAIHPTGLRISEPTIGVTAAGNLFVPTRDGIQRGPQDQGGLSLSVLRSSNGGRSWDLIPVPGSVGADLDPWLWVDPDTSRVFRVSLMGTCAEIGASDDEGRTWTHGVLRGCGLPGGHYEKLTTGPPPRGVTTVGYRNVVYYASSLLSDYLADGVLVGHTAGVWVSPSLDGGKTWQPGALAHPRRDACYGWGGPVVVAPDGTAYSPAQYCDGIRIAVSKDGGASWKEDAMLTDRGAMGGFLGPSMAVDGEGRAYLVYPAKDGHAVLRIRDPASGAWSAAIDVTPPGVGATTFTLVDAESPGRIALAFLGTASDPAKWPRINPTVAPDDADWHLYVALSPDARTPDPTFVAYRLTPLHDPVQRGCIDLQGSQTPVCRNLADFIDLTLEEGRPVVVFGDGCLRCPNAATSRESALAVARMTDGTGWVTSSG